MARRPYFPLYCADWLADAQVSAMTAEERGVYVDLLLRCFMEGSIPAPPPLEVGREWDESGTGASKCEASSAGKTGRNSRLRQWQLLSSLARVDVRTMRRVWPAVSLHFEACGEGRLTNARALACRDQAAQIAAARATAGAVGALTRWRQQPPAGGRAALRRDTRRGLGRAD